MGGIWDDIYRGPFGRLAGSLQYSFSQKYRFEGLGFSPKQNEDIVFTCLLNERRSSGSLEERPAGPQFLRMEADLVPPFRYG
jgi:hypothetical protein